MRHTALWWCTHIPNKYYLKNNYLTLRSKVKVPRRSLRYVITPPYGHAPTYQISLIYLERQKCYGPDKKILFKKQLFDLAGQRSRSHKGHYDMRHTALWWCTHIPNKYYLKNNYLTFRSKVKVPRRSLWYVTHRLMVMHPHTKYHWPISKDKNVMARTRKYYLKNNYLTLRSKVKVPQRSRHKVIYGKRHTALWSCTHIPNIIDLSGKTKKLWSGQASLRRSRRRRGRKNQTKTICLPSFEGET